MQVNIGNETMRKKTIAYIVIIAAILSAPASRATAADTDNPRLVLESYVINEGSADTVAPGVFELGFTLKNNSAIGLVNTILTYEQRSSYIVPVHGRANVEYIGAINANQAFSGTLGLYVPEDAPTGLHRLEIILSYNPADQAINSHLTTAFSIYIYISNNPGLDLKQVELSEAMTDAGRRYLYIVYENPGAIDFRNLQLIVEGNISDQQKTQVLPILKAGRSNSIEYPVQFTETGDQHINVYISYNDDTGNAYQTPVISKQVNITDTGVPDGGSPMNPRPEGYVTKLLNTLMKRVKTPAFLLMLFIAAAAIAAIALIITNVRKQAKRKKWYYKKNDTGNKK